MAGSPLVDLSLELSIKIVKLYEYLAGERKEFVMSKQILRSATSI
jgi:four helix bundle protein